MLKTELKNNNKWELIDPLELKSSDLEEFSIYNLKALFYNV